MIEAGFNIPTIDDVALEHKQIFLKVDFNLTIKPDGTISDDRKVVKTIPTIKHLLTRKNRLILVSHLGMLDENDQPKYMRVVADHLSSFFPKYNVLLVKDFRNKKERKKIENQSSDEIIVLENIRLFPEEKKNDELFAKDLASLADVYVTDAFAVSHRKHASVVGVPHFLPSYAGFLMKTEVEMISRAIKDPEKPVVSIISGKKISTKLPLIRKLMQFSDQVLTGGGIANNLLKASGTAIGKSLIEEDSLSDAKKILQLQRQMGAKLLIPTDVVVSSGPKAKSSSVRSVDEIKETEMILDIGPETIERYEKYISDASTIIWNGPVGLFENDLFAGGTDAVYKAIISNKHAISIVGGSDTFIAIADRADRDNITHISTGGGAMLKFIEKGTLPGLEALRPKGSR